MDDGAVSLTGGAITLGSANVLGAVTVVSGTGDISLTESDAIAIAGITRTDGDLTLNAGTNAITQSGVVAVDDGAVSLTGGSITLGSANVLGSSDGSEWNGRHLTDGERRDCDCGHHPYGRRSYFKCWKPMRLPKAEWLRWMTELYL